MKKILNYVLIPFYLIITCAFCGCNQQNVRNGPDNLSVTTEETTMRLYDKQISVSDDIKDYKIQYDEDEALKISVTTYTKLGEIKSTLDTLRAYSSKQPMISDVESIAQIEEFRKFSIENEEQYYCIFSDENENKLYLFFDQFGNNRWRCYSYSEFTSINMDEENNLNKYINPLDK